MSDHRIGVLASGRGSNLQAIMDACAKKTIPGRVAVVISDNPDAYALQRASGAAIPAFHINPAEFDSKKEYEKIIVRCLKEHEVRVVCLAGYMRLLGQEMLSQFNNKILNIHPALLPAFPGLHGQEQALNYGVRYSGCTVHFVDAGMDEGPIILQAVVPVLQDDTPDTLADRILEKEHQIYPEAVKLFLEDRLMIEGRRVRIL